MAACMPGRKLGAISAVVSNAPPATPPQSALARVITSESLASPELTKANFDEFQEGAIGVVKWIRQAVKDGKLELDDPVGAGKQFLALIETFAFWPQLFSYKPVPGRKAQQAIIDSAVEMFLNSYET